MGAAPPSNDRSYASSSVLSSGMVLPRDEPYARLALDGNREGGGPAADTGAYDPPAPL